MSRNTKLIVGLCVGIGLFVIIVMLIVIIACYVLRSRRRSKDTSSAVSYNDLRNRQPYTDVSNTTRSFMFGSEHLNEKPEESVNVVTNQY